MRWHSNWLNEAVHCQITGCCCWVTRTLFLNNVQTVALVLITSDLHILFNFIDFCKNNNNMSIACSSNNFYFTFYQSFFSSFFFCLNQFCLQYSLLCFVFCLFVIGVNHFTLQHNASFNLELLFNFSYSILHLHHSYAIPFNLIHSHSLLNSNRNRRNVLNKRSYYIYSCYFIFYRIFICYGEASDNTK